MERDDDRGGDNEAGEDSSGRYESDYGNEDDSNTRGVIIKIHAVDSDDIVKCTWKKLRIYCFLGFLRLEKMLSEAF